MAPSGRGRGPERRDEYDIFTRRNEGMRHAAADAAGAGNDVSWHCLLLSDANGGALLPATLNEQCSFQSSALALLTRPVGPNKLDMTPPGRRAENRRTTGRDLAPRSRTLALARGRRGRPVAARVARELGCPHRLCTATWPAGTGFADAADHRGPSTPSPTQRGRHRDIPAPICTEISCRRSPCTSWALAHPRLGAPLRLAGPQLCRSRGQTNPGTRVARLLIGISDMSSPAGNSPAARRLTPGTTAIDSARARCWPTSAARRSHSPKHFLAGLDAWALLIAAIARVFEQIGPIPGSRDLFEATLAPRRRHGDQVAGDRAIALSHDAPRPPDPELHLSGVGGDDLFDTIVRRGRRGRSSGFDTVLVMDHFQLPMLGARNAMLGCYTAARWHSTPTACACRTRHRNTYRNPRCWQDRHRTRCRLQGRAQLGVGAGWYGSNMTLSVPRHLHRSFRASGRGLQIVTGMCSAASVRHWQAVVHRAGRRSTPRPVAPIPIMIGGAEEDATRRAYADGQSDLRDRRHSAQARRAR